MRLKESNELINKNPKIKEDITLFKIILMPLELYVLKYFLSNLRPLNIREVYTHSIFTIFHHLFNPEDLQIATQGRNFVEDIVGAGYGYNYVDNKKREKIIRKYHKEDSGLSETKSNELMLKEIISNGSKTPSYDKFKSIFENFERLGIIYKRGKEGKGIVYGLNPTFYSLFKDKIEEILNL